MLDPPPNIHAGGASEYVGPNSAGCQVIWGGWEGAPWQAFINAIDDSGQTSFDYYLVDGWKLGKIAPVAIDAKPLPMPATSGVA